MGAGEWGHEFLSFEVDRGPMRREHDGKIDDGPVQALARDPSGKLWAVLGGGRSDFSGALLRLDDGDWTVVAATRARTFDAAVPCKVNWSAESTRFLNVTFDVNARPLLSTTDGLYRLEPSGGWTPVRSEVLKEPLELSP
jgi:hypothetical protein